MEYLSFKKFKKQKGSILIETLISIVLLGLIVIGSFYSYTLVHQRILSQRQQRVALGVLQGWMEQTTSYLFTYMNPNDPSVDPNDLMRPAVQLSIENAFLQDFYTDIATMFVPGTDIVPGIDLSSNDRDIVDIRIWVTINGLPVTLFSQLYTKQSWAE